MPRVVFDTNVWVSLAITPEGTCGELLCRLVTAGGEVFTSDVLLNELVRVVRRKLRYGDDEIRDLVDFVRATATIVEPKETVRVITEKDDDNRVLECAIAADADYIVSGDTKHLLPLRVFQGIPIRAPRTVLDQLS